MTRLPAGHDRLHPPIGSRVTLAGSIAAFAAGLVHTTAQLPSHLRRRRPSPPFFSKAGAGDGKPHGEVSNLLGDTAQVGDVVTMSLPGSICTSTFGTPTTMRRLHYEVFGRDLWQAHLQTETVTGSR